MRYFLIIILGFASLFMVEIQAANDSNELPGIYRTELPSASGMGRVIHLLLYPDNSFVFIEKYLGREPDAGFVSSGQWRQADTVLELSLSQRDGEPIQEQLKFQIQDKRLAYQGQDYGVDGLHLEQR